MFRKNVGLALSLVFTATAAAACKDEAPVEPPPPAVDGGMVMVDGDGGVIDPPDGGVVGPALAESSKASLRFKRNERIRNDFAQALDFPATQLCNELGQYSCTEFVHTIALGGVEPYTLGLREALPDTTVTAPNAVDRVALSGCEKRVTADFGNPGAALIFKDLPVDPDGTLGDVNAAGVSQSMERLYKRALQRVPTEAEQQHMRDLYGQIAATGQPDAARDWAILSCFAVLTTMESLFY